LEPSRGIVWLQPETGSLDGLVELEVTKVESQYALRRAEFEEASLLVEDVRDRLLQTINYTKDDSSIDVNIVSDSPMIQSLAMMLNNPMMMSGSGQKLIRVQGNKAALEWEGSGGSINVLIMGSVLVTVEGYEVTEDDLVQYAEAVNYDLIKEIMSK